MVTLVFLLSPDVPTDQPHHHTHGTHATATRSKMFSKQGSMRFHQRTMNPLDTFPLKKPKVLTTKIGDEYLKAFEHNPAGYHPSAIQCSFFGKDPEEIRRFVLYAF